MKILSIVSAAYKGGATFSFLYTIKGLCDSGIDITVVSPREGFLCEQLSKLEIPYTISPITFSVWPSLNSFSDFIKFIPRVIWHNLTNFRSFFKLNKFVKEWKPDIIHTNVSVIDIGYKLAKVNKIPHVWHIREYGDIDFNFHFFPFKFMYTKKLHNSYSIAITNSLKSYYNLGSKCKVIYNGIASPKTPFSSLNRKNTIIYVGSLTKNKGVHDLVLAFIRYLSESNKYRLEIFGEGAESYKRELKRIIIDNHAETQIELKGFHSNIYKQMQIARAIIISSKCEGFGRITAEAMINGCLVIGHNTGGTKEQFDNGLKYCGSEIGFRFNSFAQLPFILKNLSILDESTLQNIANKAKETVLHYYNIQSNISQTIKFFNEIKREHH